MKLRELFKFEMWRFATECLNKDFYEMSILCRLLTVLGSAMIVLGVTVFVTAPQWGTSSYNYTVKLEAPQPILSGSCLLAANDRVYVFSEEMCAVNVYGESGEFLFCVRGPRAQNGKAIMFLSGTDIYIVSRKHVLYRFDENGVYRGRADGSSLYDSHDQPVTALYITKGGEHVQPAYFDDSGIWYYAWYDDVGRILFYSDGTTVERIGPVERDGKLFVVKMENCIYAESSYCVADGGAAYSAWVNKVYQTTDSGTTVFAQTSLYLYYIKSAGLGWLTMVLGMLFKHLAEKLFQRKQAKKQCAA